MVTNKISSNKKIIKNKEQVLARGMVRGKHGTSHDNLCILYYIEKINNPGTSSYIISESTNCTRLCLCVPVNACCMWECRDD